MSTFITIPLRLPSEAPDLTCADGEVESFTNVEWLQALLDNQKVSSGSHESSDNSSANYSVTSLPLGINLSYGSRLLAIHSPQSLQGGRRYIVLLQNYALLAMKPSGDGQYLLADTYTFPGEIISTACFRDFILIAGKNGMLFIVYDGESDSYFIPAGRPKAPDVTFTMQPTILPDYVNSAGDRPQLNIAVDLPDPEEISSTMLSNWLDKGSATAVNATVKSYVFRAVGRAVANYITEARARNVFLAPVKCIATFDDHLPSRPIAVGYPDSDNIPNAFLGSWAYHAGTLHLQLYFSLRPLELRASLNIDEDQQDWVSLFPTLKIYSTSETPLFPQSPGNLEATALTPYTNPATGEMTGYSFRFPGYTEAEKTRMLQSREDFRLIAQYPIATAAASNVRVRCPSSSDPVYKPDYSDFNNCSPTSGIATDQGFILFGGTAGITEDGESFSNKPLGGSILSSDTKYPFLLRYFNYVSDGEIMAITATSAARSAAATGRHPVNILSTDGIRQLQADGAGGYLNARLLSRLSVTSPLTASYADTTYFFTSTGLHSISLSGTIKYLGAPKLSTEESASFIDSIAEWDQMFVMGENEVLLLRGPGRTCLLDPAADRYRHLEEISLRQIVDFDGTLFTLSPSGNLQEIELERTVSPAAPATRTQTASILTRPLKFGAPFSGTRLRGVRSASSEVVLTLEGSQNLKDWIELGSGQGIIFPLHLPSIKFFRLRARTNLSNAPLLASFQFLIDNRSC